MLRTLAAALLAGLLPSGARAADAAPAAPRQAEEERAAPVREDAAARQLPAGRVESPGARVEILGQPVRVGEDRVLPEGFIRVEEEGIEDREVGSFSIVPARTLRPSSTARIAAAGPSAQEARPVQDGRAPSPPVTAPREGPCRPERVAYLRELWSASGIEVADPEAVLEGLESGGGAASGFYWFALATDPFRPLAWSSGLRARADALARCVRGQ